MNILSKSAPAEESIQTMQTVLKDIKCGITFAQEKHPLENCYSVNLASAEAPLHIYSNGKGTTTQASTASALGEYIERLQTNNFFIDFYLPNRQYYPDEIAFDYEGDYLNNELRTIYNAFGELSCEDLVDFNSDYENKIVALPFRKCSNNEKVYIPLNILSNLYVSNGLATGNTPKEAQVQALSEIFERYCKIQIIKNGYSLPSFPEEVVRSFEKLHTDITKLRDEGYIIEVLDASLGGKFPVTAISLINPKNSTLFVSFGAHPILEVSLERTMSELMQGRDINNLDAFEVPTFDMEFVSDSLNLESHFIDSNGKLGFAFLSSKKSFEFAPWKYQGEGSEDEYNFLNSIVYSMKKEIYLREYNYLGFYSCQMIVPSISEVYPIDDMIYNNRNIGKYIREMVLNFTQFDPEEILEAIDSLDNSLAVDKYIGVIFKNNFTIEEFKAQIYLLAKQKDEAQVLLEYGTNKIGLIVAELIHMENQKFVLSDYESALFDVFGKKNVQKALKILEGSEYLIDVSTHQDYLNMLDMYDRLEKKKETLFV